MNVDINPNLLKQKHDFRFKSTENSWDTFSRPIWKSITTAKKKNPEWIEECDDGNGKIERAHRPIWCLKTHAYAGEYSAAQRIWVDISGRNGG